MKYLILPPVVLIASCTAPTNLDGWVIISEIRSNGFQIPSRLHINPIVRKTLVTGTDNGGEAAISNEAGREITIVSIGVSKSNVQILSVITAKETILTVQSGASIVYSYYETNGSKKVMGDANFGNKMSALVRVIKSSKEKEVDIEKMIK